MLRNVPSDDYIQRPWATNIAAEFGRVAMRHGVIVANDPNGLAKASSKMYFQLFPEEVRPRTLISRDREELKAFAREEGRCVLKPLQGSGGASVFLVEQSDIPNVNQMIDAVSRDGYVIAQEYLPAAEDGDMRLFVMNGRPLRARGKYAAFRRVRSGGDMRSNIHAGGRLAPAEVTDKDLKIAEIVRPKLVQDGMFLVGLDNGCIRHKATHGNHVWSYDFLADRTEDGRQLKLLVVIDEFTRECLAIEAGRTFTARDVILTLQYLFAARDAPLSDSRSRWQYQLDLRDP